MSYIFGNTSIGRLNTCEGELILIMQESLKVSMIDFGIAEGHRSKERQKMLFDQKLSKIDGIKQMGKHNYNPSRAVDIYAWVNGKASWSERNLCYLGGVITATAERLRLQGKIKSKIRWGANWNMDGEIITDQTFQDLPHYELI